MIDELSSLLKIIAGEWWKEDIGELYTQTLKNGGDPNNSSAFLVNGQPGDLYPCSKPGLHSNPN
jgi:laccase